MIVSTLSRVKQKAGKRANAPGLDITNPIGKQERLYPMNTSNLNSQQERFVIRRGLAMIVGASILAASSYAVIVKGNLDFAHALLICAMAAGLFAGAVSVGAVFVQKRYTLAGVLVLALICGELFSVLTSGERIVAERAADQARVEILKAAHVYAETELVKAQASHNEAVREKMRLVLADVVAVFIEKPGQMLARVISHQDFVAVAGLLMKPHMEAAAENDADAAVKASTHPPWSAAAAIPHTAAPATSAQPMRSRVEMSDMRYSESCRFLLVVSLQSAANKRYLLALFSCVRVELSSASECVPNASVRSKGQRWRHAF